MGADTNTIPHTCPHHFRPALSWGSPDLLSLRASVCLFSPSSCLCLETGQLNHEPRPILSLIIAELLFTEVPSGVTFGSRCFIFYTCTHTLTSPQLLTILLRPIVRIGGSADRTTLAFVTAYLSGDAWVLVSNPSLLSMTKSNWCNLVLLGVWLMPIQDSLNYI